MLVLIWTQTVCHSDTVVLKKSFEIFCIFHCHFTLPFAGYAPIHIYMYNPSFSRGCGQSRAQLLITFSNSLDPDHDQQNVDPDLDQNCSPLWYCNPEDFFLKKKTPKNSIDILLSLLQAMPRDTQTQTIRVSAEDVDRVERSWMWKVTSVPSAGKVSCRRQRYRFIFGPIQARGLSHVDFAEKRLNKNNI